IIKPLNNSGRHANSITKIFKNNREAKKHHLLVSHHNTPNAGKSHTRKTPQDRLFALFKGVSRKYDRITHENPLFFIKITPI
ncbi:MAG: hypothetical protein ACO3P4_08070, partial [Polynucleobacter sp.]